MLKSYLFNYFKRLKFTRNYFFLSILYGVSTLLIPFGVQTLVNNLTLSGLWISTLTFLVIIGIGFAVTLFVKYIQFLLIEYMQRYILYDGLNSWLAETNKDKFKSPYFFENFKILKSFSYICDEGMDFILTFFFGILAIAVIHPAFLVLSLLLCLVLVVVRIMGTGAISTSIDESSRKYDLYFKMDQNDQEEYSKLTKDYLLSRDKHFSFIKRQSKLIYVSCFFLQIFLLAWGIHLFQINQVSIGQLVSAEIIWSNIFMNVAKLPKLLETFYDFETGCYKIEYAKGGDA